MRSIPQNSVQCACDFGKQSGSQIFPLKYCPDDTRKPPTMPGVYMIVNCLNHYVYIGSTVNLRERHTDHFRLLRKGKHVNAHLQSASNLYGPDAFFFHVLEHITDPSQLLLREQHYIDTRNPEYNIAL